MNSHEATLSFFGLKTEKPPITTTAMKALHNFFRSTTGFSLTEMIIVLGTMGVVLMLTGEWLASQTPTWRLNGATRQLVSDLLAAKMKAVAKQNKQRVIFQDDHRYVLLDDKNNNGKPDPGESLENRNIQKNYPNVILVASNHPIFLPRGTASSLATIILSNSAGTRIITISITGRVKVKT